MTKVKDISTGFGELSYDGVPFGPFREVTFSYEPRQDSSGRSTASIVCRLTVHSIIHGSDATSSTRSRTESRMDSIAEKLTAQGKRLKISDIGLGSAIDTGGATPDINFGPKPKLITCKPAGGDLAWEVDWSVEFEIAPKCLSGAATAGAISEFSFGITYTTNNEEGLVERIISGSLKIVQYVAGRKIVANPEAALDRINFNIPMFFRRVTSSRSINEAKNGIDFTIVDAELVDDVYPDGIIAADVDIDFENRPPGFLQWTGQLSGSLRVAPGLPKSLAADKFFIIMFDQAAKLNEAAATAKGGIVIPERIRFSAKKFGRTSRFLVTWRMVACLHEILAKAGLWDAVPGTNYQTWRASMADVFNIRGISRTRFNANDDVVFDLCSSPSAISIGNDISSHASAAAAGKLSLGCPEVTPERSYLQWQNRIRGTQKQNAIIHRIMQIFTGAKNGSTGNGSVSPFPTPHTGADDHVLQYQSVSDNFVIMQGRALRLKFEPEIPELKSVAGVKVRELGRAVEVGAETSYFDCPLIGARWAILYRAEGELYGVRAPQVKELCMQTGESDGRAK